MAKALPVTNPRAADVGENIFRQLKARLSDVWDQFSGEDLELIQQCTADAGVLAVAAMVAPITGPAQQKLLREKAHLHAQLMNLTSAEKDRVVGEFWNVVQAVLQGAVAIVFAAV